MTDPLTPRLRGLGTTIFSEINRLAAASGAINLGQGAPSFDGPDFLKEAAIEAIRSGHNQYAPSPGTPELTAAIAEHQRRCYGLTYDAASEVTVTAGASEALFAALQALVGPGDEVLLFEPFYDSYRAGVAAAGATARVVTLEAPDFCYDREALERAITPATRVLLVNTPHNPSGKVFRRDELEHLVEVAERHDLILLSDEVYEHLVFEGEHVPTASLPGAFERTVTISSAGKTFSFTGWKIGWACAPEPLTRALRTAHQFITFCQPAPFQHAIAVGLDRAEEYLPQFLAEYRARRDCLCRGLAGSPLAFQPPAGTYFVLTDIRPTGYDDDMTFCRMLAEEVGVAAIPNSAFYVNKERGKHLVRFAFCKEESVLEEAARRLAGLEAKAAGG